MLHTITHLSSAEARLLLVALLLPPLAIYKTSGLSSTFYQNLFLTLLGFLPGLLHACVLLLSRPRATASF